MNWLASTFGRRSQVPLPAPHAASAASPAASGIILQDSLPPAACADEDGDEGDSCYSSALLMPEVIQHVLSLMSPEAVLYVAPVCSAWRDAAHSPTLWSGRVCPRLLAACSLSRGRPDPSTHHAAAAAAREEQPSTLPGEAEEDPAAPPPLPGLSDLGAPLQLPHLWLAFHERNFLGNPSFRQPVVMGSLLGPRFWVSPWGQQTDLFAALENSLPAGRWRLRGASSLKQPVRPPASRLSPLFPRPSPFALPEKPWPLPARRLKTAVAFNGSARLWAARA
jgi:hypothetical protein